MAAINNIDDRQFEVYKERLFDEATKGNLVMIKAIAKKNPALLNCIDDRRYTILHVAATHSRMNVVEWLLSDEGRAAGFSSVLSRSEKGLTALHLAVARGHLECFKAIVFGCKEENGERGQMLNAVSENGHTVLHLARGDLTAVKWLLSHEKGGGREAGFNSVLSKSEGGFTALHLAVLEGDLECLKAIVFGCKVENGEREQMLNAADANGNTILHAAAVKRQLYAIKWLLSDKKGGGREAGFNCVLAANKHRQVTALHVAAHNGDFECFTAIVEGCKVDNGERKKLLNAVSIEGVTVLHYAAQHGHISIIKWLLSKGRDNGFESIIVTMINASSTTALDEAAAKGHLGACKAIVHGCKVENGERDQMLNGVNDLGLTALHFAAVGGYTPIVSWLLSDKPGGGRTLGFKNVLARSKNEGATALQFAARQGHVETLKAIVNGCKVENGEREKMLNAVSELGLTVVHYAASCGRPDIVSWLLSHDADGGRANGLKSETITTVTNLWLSALHFAVQYDSVETLRALLSSCTVGEKLKLFLTCDQLGWTVLHSGARLGRVDNIRELLLHHEETKMIVDHRDHRGMTALHRVILYGGVDEESKEEWEDGVNPDDANLAPREEVVAALLTYEIDDDDDEKGGAKGQAASSSKKTNKKKKQQQQQQQQQAAWIDVNLGLKIEKKEE